MAVIGHCCRRRCDAAPYVRAAHMQVGRHGNKCMSDIDVTYLHHRSQPLTAWDHRSSPHKWHVLMRRISITFATKSLRCLFFLFLQDQSNMTAAVMSLLRFCVTAIASIFTFCSDVTESECINFFKPFIEIFTRDSTVFSVRRITAHHHSQRRITAHYYSQLAVPSPLSTTHTHNVK